MIIKTQGIVFRQTKFSETSIIASIYTSDLGLQSYIVQGIRKQGSKQKAGLLQPGNYLDLEVYHRPDKNLNRIKELKPSKVYQLVPFDVVRGMLLLFMMEVCNHSIKEEEPNDPLFQFLVECLQYLDRPDGNITYFPQQFMLYLSVHLGFKPNYSDQLYFDLVEGSFHANQPVHSNYIHNEPVELLKRIIQTQRWEIPSRSFSKKVRLELLNTLITYYRLHIHSFKPIKSIQVLRQVMDA